MKYLVLALMIVSLCGCSKVSTTIQNVTGHDVEAYYSKKLNVVCFTTSSSHQDNIYCLPGSQVMTFSLSDGKWNVI